MCEVAYETPDDRGMTDNEHILLNSLQLENDRFKTDYRISTDPLYLTDNP